MKKERVNHEDGALMNKVFIKKDLKYTGKELTPHWIYKNFNLQGDAIVGFAGEVEVKLTEMVDIEDVLAQEPIYSKKMLNFIIEHFNVPLFETIFRQRIFIAIIKESLESRGFTTTLKGDDLFFEGRKLTVSIATKSLTSTLIHTGVNIFKDGAPIEVSCLDEMGIKNIEEFANEIMGNYEKEVQSAKMALSKVRGVF